MRFIELSSDERKILSQIYKQHIDHRVRTRAQAILLSSRGYKMDYLAELFEVDRDTIGQWMDLAFIFIPQSPMHGNSWVRPLSYPPKEVNRPVSSELLAKNVPPI